MEFSYSYAKSSHVESHPYRTAMSFSPDTSRQPTFFSGELRKGVAFREAISALHDVVVSDLRFKPKDRTQYLEWRAKQDEIDWVTVMRERMTVKSQIDALQAELQELWKRRGDRWATFEKAKRAYFNYLYQKDRDAWFVLDPVITVHPDEIFFECFSQDESSYGKLGASYEVFHNIGEFACGTTNIDYSHALYEEFQKVRSYKTTKLEVDPTGFDVKTQGEADFKEVKIDLPDTWVRGFLQVSSAMSLPARTFELHPMDVHNLLFVLRRRKEKLGPRSLRFRLSPDKPVRVVIDPWNLEVECPRSVYKGSKEEEVRIWGRRRLFILERLIPVARNFTVHLLGHGLPSFWVADLGDMSFTLGLSGWTTNDWSRAGQFDLLAPRGEVDVQTKVRVFETLKERWLEKTDDLSSRAELPRATVLSALSAWTQAGRAIYDLSKGVWRVRELSRDPLPMDKLRFANEREQAATALVAKTKATSRELAAGAFEVTATVIDKKETHQVRFIADSDGKVIEAQCDCSFFKFNRLLKGPCEHILAARMRDAAARPVLVS